MSELDAYLQFRKELDTMFFKAYSNSPDVHIVTKKNESGDVIAMLIVESLAEGDYIDCLWVDKAYRRKHIASEMVQEYLKTNPMPARLHIINNNHVAKKFWNKIFKLSEIDRNPYDCLYLIRGLVED